MSNLPDKGEQGERGERGPQGDHGQTGATGEQGEKGKSFLNFNRLQLFAFLVVAAFAAYGNYQAFTLGQENEATLTEIEANRSVNCRAYEAKHAEEIDNLKDPPQVYSELLENPIVLADFRETILAAANDEDTAGEFVPPACDKPNTGLAEPDPPNVAVPSYVEELLPGITRQVVKAENEGVRDPKGNGSKKSQQP
jgi:hypothetical protein